MPANVAERLVAPLCTRTQSRFSLDLVIRTLFQQRLGELWNPLLAANAWGQTDRKKSRLPSAKRFAQRQQSTLFCRYWQG